MAGDEQHIDIVKESMVVVSDGECNAIVSGGSTARASTLGCQLASASLTIYHDRRTAIADCAHDLVLSETISIDDLVKVFSEDFGEHIGAHCEAKHVPESVTVRLQRCRQRGGTWFPQVPLSVVQLASHCRRYS